MIKENEGFELNIKAGPGWKESQTRERDDLIKKIEKGRNSVKDCKVDTIHMREQIINTEAKIKDNEKLFNMTMKELKKLEDLIDQSNTTFIEVQKQLHEFDNRTEMLKLNLSQERELLSSFKTDYKRKIMKRNSVKEKIDEAQGDIDRIKKKMREISKTRDKVEAELDKQKEKNNMMEVQNVDKLCQIRNKREDIGGLASETEILIKKKDLLSQKIVNAEKCRVQMETEKDEVKIKLNKLISVEMSMKKRENEIQKRQRESLEREMTIVERKKDLCEKSSSILLDLIRSSETTFKTLKHDLEVLQMNAREYHGNIQALKEGCHKHYLEAEVSSKRFDDALIKLHFEEEAIRNIHLQLENSELLLKQKQHICETLKNECNARSKALVKNHEEIARAKKEYNVIDRQINLIKVDITNIENDLVTEHFNHHHANEDRDILIHDLEATRNQIDDVHKLLDVHDKKILELQQSIQMIDKDCDKYVKDYGTIIGYRDSIDNILLRKNEDLERIEEKIRIQQSMVHHSANEYQERLTTITHLAIKLKNLNSQKKALEDNGVIIDKLFLKCRCLESDIQVERSKTLTLKEELGRPFNIHRWRTLELQHPAKFEKIQKIQKLQRHVIATTEAVADKDRSLRAIETVYFETKRIADRQPQLSEITQQVNIYEATLDENLTQMKNIELDLNLTKKDVEQIKKTLKSLDVERNRMKSTWIDSVK